MTMSMVTIVAVAVLIGKANTAVGGAFVVVATGTATVVLDRVVRPAMIRTKPSWVRGSKRRLIAITAHDAFADAVNQ
jgi:hypothetical protein